MQNFVSLNWLEEIILLCVLIAFSTESWMTFLIAELRLGYFWHYESKKLRLKFPVSECTARWQSFMCLKRVLQGVLDDILDSWMETRWFCISGISKLNTKETLSNNLRLWIHWKWTISYMCLQSDLQGVLEDILDFGKKSWWLWTSRLT